MHCAGHSFGGAVAACLAGLLDGAIDVEAPAGDDGDDGGGHSERSVSGGLGGSAAAVDKRQRQQKHKQRAAAVTGARGEAFRDRRPGENGGISGGGGRSRSSSSRRLSGPSSSEGSEESGEKVDVGGGAVRVGRAAPWVGACRDGVTCVTLGCPPCLSQNLRLPFVTSFVLGDDMVPRTSHESLRRLKRRLLQASCRWNWCCACVEDGLCAQKWPRRIEKTVASLCKRMRVRRIVGRSAACPRRRWPAVERKWLLGT